MPRIKPKTRRRLATFLITMPFFALVLLFSYGPLFGWSYAFVDYVPGIPVFKQGFAGLRYFGYILRGMSNLPSVIRNTLVLSLLGMACSPIPVIFAMMLSQIRSSRLSKVIQTVSSLPNFISWVIVYGMAFSFFAMNDGAINKLLLALHLIKTPTDLLGNARFAWYFQTILGIWKGTGWGAIIYLAAMAGIDPELYDAADVDGANRLRKIWHITVPGILPTYFVLLLLSIANMLSNGFEQYFMFQNMLVVDRLEVLDTFLYRVGIALNLPAYSTAMGICKSLISILLLVIANQLSRLVRKESIL